MSLGLIVGVLILAIIFAAIIGAMSISLERWWAGPAIMVVAAVLTGAIVLAVALIEGAL